MMERSQAARILSSIARNVEMDGARAAVLRGGVPAPLSEVGEALAQGLDLLEVAAIRDEERCPYCRALIYRWEKEADIQHGERCPRKMRLDALSGESDGAASPGSVGGQVSPPRGVE